MTMDTIPKQHAGRLIKSVAILLLKLLLNAARDLVLIPVALVAALLDLVLIKTSSPRFYRQVLRLGDVSDRWIDVWSDGSDKRENVDALLARIEEVVRDPQTGARRARILKRWAERQMKRARQRAAARQQVPSDALVHDAAGSPSDESSGIDGEPPT